VPESNQPKSRGVRIVGVELLEDEIGPVIQDERRVFLHAAAERPEIRLGDSLRSVVHSKVAALPPSYWQEPYSAESKARRDALDKLMSSWAESFNLGVEWVILEAWHAVNLWQSHPNFDKPFTSRIVYLSPPDFDVPIFLPQDELPERYRTRVLQAFTEALDRYVEDSQTRYRSHKPPTTRKRTVEVEVKDRYTWAALRVCCPWSYERIARSIGHRVTAKRIENAVRDVCGRIDLPIPNLRAGNGERLRSEPKPP
jgi:hypothetical protein